MPELIDKEKLLRDLCGMCCAGDKYKCRYPCGECDAVMCIKKQPTIEPEVRRGRWENPTESKPRMFERTGHTFTERQCSECKHWNISVTGSITCKYCPHCGARMDADEIAERRAAADDYAEY